MRRWPVWALGWVVASWLGWCFSVGTGAAEWTEGRGFRSRSVRAEGAGKPGFTRMWPGSTGVAFTNVLAGDAYLTNFVAHNGAGVAIGDVDGDGRPDVYFCGLQSTNRLFRNLGQWRFAELPLGEAACAGQFSTGVVLADVDGDGDLDLLVSGIAAGTRLFRNDGKAAFTEAKESGLSRTSSPTTLALADIDGDGDLDIYAAHYLDVMHLMDRTIRFALARQGEGWVVQKVNGEPATSARWKDRFEALADGSVRELPEVHALYRNDGKGRFTAIQAEPGVFMDEQGKPVAPARDWGLAAMFRDLNGDGAPDLYVCNDNASPDRIWINSGEGRFRALASSAIRHTSRSSMGVDVADVDRDGRMDIFVTDMLARSPARRLQQLVRDQPDPVEVERSGSRPAFNRNTLLFGRPDGSFAEAALMAGVAATDWSWCPAFLDVDLDGYEDLLVTNGFDLDVMDQDSNDLLRVRLRGMNPEQKRRSRQWHPSFRTPNAAFRNRGDGSFESVADAWGFAVEGVSHGLALGDLDDDGDLDVVINSFNDAALFLRNDAPGGRIGVVLRGAGANTSGLGARIRLSGEGFVQSQEMVGGGRYLSGDQSMRVFAAVAANRPARTLEVTWRDGKRSVIEGVEPDRIYEVFQANADNAGVGLVAGAPVASPWFREASSGLGHRHADVAFDELARQPLLPWKLGRSGPGVAWCDLNGDGWEDLFFGAGRGGRPEIYLNEAGQRFRRVEGGVAVAGEQVSVTGWPDGTGARWILAMESNYGLPAETETRMLAYPATNLWGVPKSFACGLASPAALAVADVDGDGDLDVFVSGRFRPGHYPEPVASSFWRNNAGRLELDAGLSAPLARLGLVSGATFADLDGDGDMDLALALDWGAVRVFLNEGGTFADRSVGWGTAESTGWWTAIVAGDFDGDGRMDLAVGNAGLNTLHQLFRPSPIRAFYGDWDGNGQIEVIEAWRNAETWYPTRSRLALVAGLPELATRFPTHASFSAASVNELLGPRFAEAGIVEVREFESVVFLNRGSRFTRLPLPTLAQRAPVFSIQVGDLDGDGTEDLFLGQNSLGSGSDLTREDAGRGLILRGRGDGTFESMSGEVTGVDLDGEQRGAALADFNHDGRSDLVVTQFGGPTRLYANEQARPGVRVTLAGPVGNPDGVGSVLRVLDANGVRGPARAVQAGSGQGSRDGNPQVMSLGERAASLWVRWPGGREKIVPLPKDVRELRVDFSHE